MVRILICGAYHKFINVASWGLSWLGHLFYDEGMYDDELSTEKRALGVWVRCWQLAGGRWPPESRAIAQQIVMMLANYLYDLGAGRLTRQAAFVLAHETMAPLIAQRFYSGSEQDIAVERIGEALDTAVVGDDQQEA